MTVKLIAVDMDGTLLRSDKTVSERSAEALRGALNRGVAVVPATGRVARMLPGQVAELRGVRYAITSNGALVRDLQTQKALYRNLMTMQQAKRLMALFDAYGLFAEVYCDGIAYAQSSMLDLAVKAGLPDNILRYILASQQLVDDLAAQVARQSFPPEKVNLPYVPLELRAQLREKILSIPGLTVTSSGMENLEINASSCSKGEALKFLCTMLSISPSQVMAVGDSDNDISMLRCAGVAVAMENSLPAVKEAANFVTGTNDGDGVAFAVEKLVLT